MGVTTYYYNGKESSAQMITNIAWTMHTNGLQAAGYNTITIAFWSDGTTNSLGVPNPDPTRYPNGVAAAVDYVHSLGFRAETDAQGDVNGTGGFTEMVVPYWTNSANQFAAWHFDTVFYDFIDTVIINGTNCSVQANATQMSWAVQSCGRPMYFGIIDPLVKSWHPGIANFSRTSFDNDGSWSTTLGIADDFSTAAAAYATPGFWPFMDDLTIDAGTSVLIFSLTPTEQRSEFALWCIGGGSLFVSNPTNMTPRSLKLVTERELIAINQDAGIHPGTRKVRTAGSGGNMDVWSKQLSNTFPAGPMTSNSFAVGVMNGTTGITNVVINFATMGLGTNVALVHDAWSKLDVGWFTNSYTAANIASHDMMVYTLNPGGSTPDAPTGIYLDPSDFFEDDANSRIYVQLRWTSHSVGASGFQVEISTNGTDFSLYAQVPIPGGSGYDSAITPWTSNRWWRVRDYYPGGTFSGYSAPVQASGYMAPMHLRGSTSSRTNMTVQWDTTGGLNDGYTVEQDTSTNFYGGNLVQYFVTNQDSTSYTITNNFLTNVTYYFRVRGTNSHVGNMGEPMNKPTPFLAVAPNGPPTQPLMTGPTTDANAGEAKLVFTDTSLNATGYQLKTSTDSNTWTVIPYITDGLYALATGLTAGTTNYFQFFATNASGFSPPAVGQLRMPNVPGAQTNWYVSPNAVAGNNTGTSWANAWVAMRSINWGALAPGNNVYVDGGTSGMTYNDDLTFWTWGATNNPIVFHASREVGHNGHIYQNGGVGWRAWWVTLDGTMSDTAPSEPVTVITNNIGWTITQLGDQGSFNAAVNWQQGVGAVCKGVECTGVGNNLSSDSITAVNLFPSTDTNGLVACEFAYNWVHDNWASGLNVGHATGYGLGFGAVNIHHNLIERFRNNGVVMTRSMDFHHNIVRETLYPAIAHPDGFQGGINNIRIWDNIIGNCEGHSGSMFYPNLDVGLWHDFYVVNNVCYETDPQKAGTVGPNSQFSMLGFGSATLSNVWIIGNTWYGVNAVSVALAGSSSFTNHTVSSGIINNIFMSGPNANPGNGVLSVGFATDPVANILVTKNVVSGPQQIMTFGTNQYNTVAAFNAATGTQNKSNAVSLLWPEHQLYDLIGADSSAKDAGSNVSSFASVVSAITNDINGVTRGLGSGWDMGATEVDPSLVAWSADGYFTNGYLFPDLTGNNHHIVAVTNQALTFSGNYAPYVGTNSDGSLFLGFWNFGTNEYFQLYNGTPHYGPQYSGYFLGSWAAISNVTGIEFLTNGTIACFVQYTNSPLNTLTHSATIFAAGTVGQDGSWELSRVDSDSEFMQFFSYFPVSGGTNVVSLNGREPTNTWIHYAVSWDATANLVTFYSNSVVVATNAMNRAFYHTTQDSSAGYPPSIGIGAHLNGGSWQVDPAVDVYPNRGWLEGYLRGIRIYTRAISAAEVAAIANGGGGTPTGGGGGGGGGGAQDPVITLNPQNATVTAPAAAVFTSTASSTNTLSYQWYRGGVSIAGATQTSYTLNPTSTNDNGAQFFMTATASSGTAQSTTATLTVNPAGVFKKTYGHKHPKTS